jgi:hypothetical protein
MKGSRRLTGSTKYPEHFGFTRIGGLTGQIGCFGPSFPPFPSAAPPALIDPLLSAANFGFVARCAAKSAGLIYEPCGGGGICVTEGPGDVGFSEAAAGGGGAIEGSTWVMGVMEGRDVEPRVLESLRPRSMARSICSSSGISETDTGIAMEVSSSGCFPSGIVGGRPTADVGLVIA